MSPGSGGHARSGSQAAPWAGIWDQSSPSPQPRLAGLRERALVLWAGSGLGLGRTLEGGAGANTGNQAGHETWFVAH